MSFAGFVAVVAQNPEVGVGGEYVGDHDPVHIGRSHRGDARLSAFNRIICGEHVRFVVFIVSLRVGGDFFGPFFKHYRDFRLIRCFRSRLLNRDIDRFGTLGGQSHLSFAGLLFGVGRESELHGVRSDFADFKPFGVRYGFHDIVLAGIPEFVLDHAGSRLSGHGNRGVCCAYDDFRTWGGVSSPGFVHPASSADKAAAVQRRR